MKRILMTAVAAAAMVLSTMVPAHAYGDVDVPNGVIYPDCGYHQLDYSAPDGDWDISGDVYDPRGGDFSFVWIYGDNPESGTTSGSDGVQFCGGWDTPGWYEFDGEYCHYDYDYDSYCTPVHDTFHMRKAYSRTSLAMNDATAAYGQRITFKAGSKAEYRNGYFGNAYEVVRFQRKLNGVWRTFATRDTNQYGVARATVAWKFRTKVPVRAVTVATSEWQRSYSPVKFVY